MELEAYLDVVRGFVDNEYVPALFNGSQLTEEELDALAEKYAGYTGLKKEYVLRSNLRVELDDFLTELLKDHVSFTYYPCGHMIYMEKASFDKFRADAQNWLG